MSDTNTIDAPAEQVTFTSRASNYRIVRTPARRRQLGETGESEVVTGKSYQFYDGALTVSDPDDIAWLREQDSCGKFYFEPETAPVEDSGGLQRVIMEKALAGDFGGIADILVAERTALSRPGIIAACEAAIRAGGEQLPAKPDTPLHEVARVRVGPTAGVTPGVSPEPVAGDPLVDPSTLTPPPEGSVPAAPGVPVSAEDSIPASEVPAEAPPVPPVPPVTPEATSEPQPDAGAEVEGQGASDAPVAPQGDPTEPQAPAPPVDESGAAGAPAA